MPPRYAYWTILAGGLPTAFRAAERDELLPTFRRIKQKHPDAELKYFAKGQLWASPEEARRPAARPPEARPRAWRPGGEHRDPRQPFKDAKKARNQRWRTERHERRAGPPSAGGTPAPKQARNRPTGPAEPARRRTWPAKATADQARRPSKPHGDPVGERALRGPKPTGGAKGGAGRRPRVPGAAASGQRRPRPAGRPPGGGKGRGRS